MTEQNKAFGDPDIIVFTFEPRGECGTPPRVVAKRSHRSSVDVQVHKDSVDGAFVWFGQN